jgi:hypothetical protein
MLKIVKADKDTYITNKIVRNKRKVDSNVGGAGTLDLFKVYGTLFDGSTQTSELSRVLIHFDLTDIKGLYQQGKIDIAHDSFSCKISLKDVYGGQPTPSNFTVSVFPLSASFDEGIGKDISYYSDSDICNWLTSSLNSQWHVSGCGAACSAQGTPGDFITSSFSLPSTEVTQTFSNDEDLYIDVTTIVSATLSGELPDRGFRISLSNSLENDTNTYFVKRFASRQAYDESKRPKLLVGFDDSISDDSQNLTFDATCKINLYNYSKNELTNIVSGSSLTQITGSNCLKLKLLTTISGGYYQLQFSGSQFSLGTNPVTGIYQASVILPSTDSIIKTKLMQSGSVEFIPVWSSLDGTVTYVSGSVLTANPQSRGTSKSLKNYVITCSNLFATYGSDEEVYTKVNIFDQTSPLIKVVKVPIELSGIVLNEVFYQIRDIVTNEAVVPFDDVKNSTKLSSDSTGMFFKFNTANLLVGHAYAIDIMIVDSGVKNKYTNVSPAFRIE